MYEDALFTARVLSIIASHDPATPLFLSWTPHVAHVPLEVPQAYLDRFAHINVSSRRSYMAMVNYIDDQVCQRPSGGRRAASHPPLVGSVQVGAVVAALKARGMWESTLWVSSADNGGPVEFSGANNWPLKGGAAAP